MMQLDLLDNNDDLFEMTKDTNEEFDLLELAKKPAKTAPKFKFTNKQQASPTGQKTKFMFKEA